jgi:site-specific recombinase XerD
MIIVKYYLDSRMTKGNAPSSLKLAISYRRKAVYIPLGVKVFPKDWDKLHGKVLHVADKDTINLYISQRKNEIDRLVYGYINDHIVFTDVFEIKKKILVDLQSEKPSNLFADCFRRYANQKAADKTKQSYLFTLKRMTDFDPKIGSKRFEDVTKSYLTDFDNYLAITSKSKNGRNVHLRNIRAVFNSAIDDNITQFYPFRTFKIRPVATRKRSLTLTELREFMTYPVEDFQRRYVDLFMLDLYLIGINLVDLCNARSIVNGRLEYQRAKTKRLYSIKVEPEALAIIERYKGKEYLLNILDDGKNYHDFLQRMNLNLKRIGKVEVLQNGKKIYEPLHSDISTYWARHTWATIAASLDIPKEVIAHALGHGNDTVTDIYINFDMKKVDDANRKVIDYIIGCL